MYPARTALRRALALKVKVHVYLGRGAVPEEVVTAPLWLVGADDDAHAARLAKSRKLQEAWAAEQILKARARDLTMEFADVVVMTPSGHIRLISVS
jgi:hypothetical protein